MLAFEKLVDYLRSSKEEARKVSWPSRQDTLRYSALVVGVALAVATFFAALDFGFTALVDVVIARRVEQVLPPQRSPTPTQPEITTSSAPVTIPEPRSTPVRPAP